MEISLHQKLQNLIDNQLDADFNLEIFYNKEEYSQQTGTARSYLICRKEQIY
jgi:hypothetical protein